MQKGDEWDQNLFSSPPLASSVIARLGWPALSVAVVKNEYCVREKSHSKGKLGQESFRLYRGGSSLVQSIQSSAGAAFRRLKR